MFGGCSVYVTGHHQLTDERLIERLWHLYDLSYAAVEAGSPSHEMLFRDEFDAAVRDASNRLWVLWDDNSPVAMMLVATDIGATRYLSRAYFEQRYADHMRRGAVHYIMWLVVHPSAMAKGAIVRLGREVAQREAADGALVVFDAPELHQPGVNGGFAEMMSRLAKAFVGPTPVVHLGTQYYFAVDFSPAAFEAADADETRPLQMPFARPL